MRNLLLLMALLCAVWAACLGWHFIDDPELTSDYSGWLAASFALFIAADADWLDR